MQAARSLSPDDASPIRWGAEDLWLQLSPLLPGVTIEVLPEIDSTNTELMRRARQGQLDPMLLVAERQTAGRGRLGRIWHSDRGDALTFSIGLPLALTDWSGLSLAIGVAVAESLSPAIGLKWPNDLWVSGASGDRKLGGILVETAAVGDRRFVVVGIGINIAPRAAEGLSMPPAALVDHLPGIDAPSALARVAVAVVGALQGFALTGFAPFVPRFHARDVLAGRQVSLSDGVSGQACGVAEDGALLLLQEDGRQRRITSSEVSVRPVAARMEG